MKKAILYTENLDDLWEILDKLPTKDRKRLTEILRFERLEDWEIGTIIKLLQTGTPATYARRFSEKLKKLFKPS